MNRLILSDIHIGDARFSVDEKLSKLIMGGNYDELILNGDILDLWHNSQKKIFKKHFKSVESINIMAKKKKIIYVIGNHDEDINSECGFDRNIKFVDNHVFEERGTKFIVAHGHIFDRTDTYFRLISRISSKIHKVIYDLIGFDAQKWLRKVVGYKGEAHKLLKRSARYYEKDFDISIIGHTHVQEKYRTENILACNCGSILDAGTYIYVSDDKVYLKKL